jgi:8-oxo-dGTP pyrophosphatase MutT (NUDIX family)
VTPAADERGSLQTAAVLVPIFRDAAGSLRLLLVVRGAHGAHGGQIGLPGGKPEAGDADLLATALREAHEEVGIEPGTVEVLGALDPLDTHSTGYRVHAFIGRVPADTTWRPREGEIAGVLTPDVATLGDPYARRTLPFTSDRFPEPLLVEGIDIEGHVLWGLTLRLLDDVVPRLLGGDWAG